ncbi:hypothetical protein E4U42_007224 [Claviceps africana]|uniref:ML-like domain-containing protein n=1 Tax=Claviceps africana TaxID=83212 RepID=A0A8K0NIT1_9HYPO|nr:hypothetical protein E4U42_007224 [Claviceps africana]
MSSWFPCPTWTLLSILALTSSCLSTAEARETAYTRDLGFDAGNAVVKRDLDHGRYPALYSGDFDDCLGGESLFNVTKFDAAYYADNLTVLFHLDGTTNLRKEDVILHFTVEAYGENRFNMTYNPCKAGVHSLCPLTASVPITALAAFSISPNDVSGIPSIALGLPDLEGLARVQIFANSTQTQIGCFQASMTNGNSLSHPKAVGSCLGAMAFVAVLASYATAIYGLSIPHMRAHYAHSFSVLVVFETFQSIFFSGALSVNWPRVLPAWWSNFAWATGMFANGQIIRSVSSFTGNKVNITQVGGAGSIQINNGGGLSQKIYGRSILPRSILPGHGGSSTSLNLFTGRAAAAAVAVAATANDGNTPPGYTWGGHPRTPGMPMPGTWPGFAGTLSFVDIPPAEAFTIYVIWLVVVLAAVALFMVTSKIALDLLIKMKWLKSDGFDYFRSHVWGYTLAGIARTLFVAFFSTMTLSMYQFTLRGAAGPTAVAVIIWLGFFIGLGGVVAYACYFRLRHGKFETRPDTLRFERGNVLGKVPFIAATRQSKIGDEEPSQKPYLFGTMPFVKVKYVDEDANRATVHMDEAYIKRFGWLSSRYRRTRWWFFAFYFCYQFVRACFIGGGARTPLAQVFGLFIFDIIALVAIMKLKPFESNRNAAVAVWMLSISKIITTGLSIAFLPAFALNRIAATVVGIFIIVVQGFVCIAVLLLIVLGVFSTVMSLSRNREEFPRVLEPIRVRYFEHSRACLDHVPWNPAAKPEEDGEKKAKEEEAKGPCPEVRNVGRAAPMMEGQELDGFPELEPAMAPSADVIVGERRSRANSASSRFSVSSLPRTTRVHRASWSSKDIPLWDSEMNRGDQQRHGRSRSGSMRLSGYYASEAQGSSTPVRRPMTPQEELLEDAGHSHQAHEQATETCVDGTKGDAGEEEKEFAAASAGPSPSIATRDADTARAAAAAAAAATTTEKEHAGLDAKAEV